MEFLPLSKGYSEKPKIKNNLILHFNFHLDNSAKYFSLNENSIESFIEQLESMTLVKDASYWLTLARIYELALLCAENYANNAELALVGDLLFNPRLILVHVKGQPRPIPKNRHISLREQFKSIPDVIQWLKTETTLETKKDAIIPHLHKKMEQSGSFSQEYFDFMNNRQKQIADLIIFLTAAGISDSLGLYLWLQKADPSDKELVRSKFCPCTLNIYSELGRKIKDFAQGPSIPVSLKNPRSMPITAKISSPGREHFVGL